MDYGMMHPVARGKGCLALYHTNDTAAAEALARLPLAPQKTHQKRRVVSVLGHYRELVAGDESFLKQGEILDQAHQPMETTLGY